MNWIKKQSSFTYNGKPVTRTAMVCNTPFGQFKVFESVGGNIFYRHPFIDDSVLTINGARFKNGLAEEWGWLPRISAKSLEDGIRKCEEKWVQVKNAVNEI